MTSNIGSAAIAATGARAGDAAYDDMKREVTDALRLQFRPEFLNRVDEVIVFHALTDADLGADRRPAHRRPRPSAGGPGPRPGADPGGAGADRPRRHGPAFGARPLKRTIQRLVENQLARALVAGEFKPGDRITADADLVSGTLVFSTEGATVVASGTRRDARSPAATEPAVAAGGRSRRSSPLDLPPTARPRDDGELVN